MCELMSNNTLFLLDVKFYLDVFIVIPACVLVLFRSNNIISSSVGVLTIKYHRQNSGCSIASPRILMPNWCQFRFLNNSSRDALNNNVQTGSPCLMLNINGWSTENNIIRQINLLPENPDNIIAELWLISKTQPYYTSNHMSYNFVVLWT